MPKTSPAQQIAQCPRVALGVDIAEIGLEPPRPEFERPDRQEPEQVLDVVDGERAGLELVRQVDRDALDRVAERIACAVGLAGGELFGQRRSERVGVRDIGMDGIRHAELQLAGAPTI